MPEGDTIHRTAATLHRALAGQLVTYFETGYAHLARVNDEAAISGRTIIHVEASGKHVLLHMTGDLVLRTHMRMSGAWHLYRQGERWRVPSRAVRIRIETAAWVALGVDVPVADFVPASRLARHAPIASLGPDVLAADFDEATAVGRLRSAGARAIGEILLDQHVMAGLGNVLRVEVLFMAGVHPQTPADAVPAEALARLVAIARRVMRSSVASGGRRTTSRLHPDAQLWVYGRAGRACRRCGSAIESHRGTSGGRRTYWCPACQPPPSDRQEGPSPD